MVERVRADQRRRHVLGDDDERGQTALHGRGFAHAEHTVIGLNAHKGAARAFAACGPVLAARQPLAAPIDLEGLDLGDLHLSPSPAYQLVAMYFASVNSRMP